MTIDEKIYQQVQKLPYSLQEELLDFVQFLLMKAERREQQEWFSLSLSSALRDMDDEPALYSLADIKVRFTRRKQGKLFCFVFLKRISKKASCALLFCWQNFLANMMIG